MKTYEGRKKKYALAKKIACAVLLLSSLFLLTSAGTAGVALKIEAGGKEYLFYPAEIGYEGGKAFLKKEEDVLHGIYLDTVTLPADARAIFTPLKKEPFSYETEKKGKGIDEKKLFRDVRAALNGGERVVKCAFIDLYPSVTVQQLKRETQFVAFFSTEYGSSSAARKNNVAAAARAIGGRMLLPGEEFSFNRAVGKRSEENGYLPAKIIENGKFADGIGGGVCQVSSTLYNAALISGLTVTERHRHSLSVSYVEPSFDAMVSDAGADLKFRNDGKTPVYFGAFADGERIAFSFYGEKGAYEYRRQSYVIRYIDPPEEETIGCGELAGGESREIVKAKKGIVSEGFLETYENGKLICRKALGKDIYAPLRGIRLIGIKGSFAGGEQP